MTQPGLIVASPLPPSASGVADYTFRLLPHLAEDWQVSVIVGESDPEPVNLPDSIAVFRPSQWHWAESVGRADRLLSCIGNSRFHLHVPRLCLDHGGVVLAHDVRMTALHCLSALDASNRHFLSEIMQRRHGDELAREIREVEERGDIASTFSDLRGVMERFNALLLGEAVRGATRVLVHSQLAARLAALDLADVRIPVGIVPFAFPDTPSVRRTPVPGRISAFGMVEPEKQPELLVEALPLIRNRVPNATIRFVGSLGGGMADSLGRIARRLGVADDVTWTDRVDPHQYERELSTVSVAAQLRAGVNGEASAAVADCLAAGAPTVVASVGWLRELPESAVLHLPSPARVTDIAESLCRLLEDSNLCARISRSALSYARNHSPAKAALALSEELDQAGAIRD